MIYLKLYQSGLIDNSMSKSLCRLFILCFSFLVCSTFLYAYPAGWSDDILINADTLTGQNYPDIGIDSNNNIWITWDDNSLLSGEIYYSKRDSLGNCLIAETNLSGNASISHFCRIACDHSDNIQFIWRDASPIGEGVWHATLANDGSVIVASHLAVSGGGGYFSTLIPAMVDLDRFPADGVAEIIIGDMNDTIRAYKERTQTTLWKTSTGGAINSSPAVGDIHPFYEPAEIAFGNDAEEIWAIRGNSGGPWNPYPIETDVVRTSPALAKLGGKFDWYPDIIVAANDWVVYGLEFDGDAITPFPLPVFGTPSSPVIGDIDGDGKSETILATGDGYLHVWRNVNSYVTPYALEWPQYHHDYQRTGLYNWVGGVGDGDASPPKFSTSTIISFSLTRTVSIQITVYDVDGNVVKNLVSQVLPKGSYNPVWYGKNNSYALLPDGIYIIEFKVENERKFIPVEIDR